MNPGPPPHSPQMGSTTLMRILPHRWASSLLPFPSPHPFLSPSPEACLFFLKLLARNGSSGAAPVFFVFGPGCGGHHQLSLPAYSTTHRLHPPHRLTFDCLLVAGCLSLNVSFGCAGCLSPPFPVSCRPSRGPSGHVVVVTWAGRCEKQPSRASQRHRRPCV